VALSGREGCLGHCLLGPSADRREFGAPDRAFIGALTGHLAAAIEALEYHDRWKRHEKFVSLGRATATIAHEIRNPLNVIQGAAAWLKTHHDGGDGRRMVEVIGAEVRRASSFIDRLLNASRRPDVRPCRVDLAAWCRKYAEGWNERHPEHPVRCGAPAEAVWAEIDPGLLEQLLGNLCRNAADAMGEGGAIELGLAPTTAAVEIRVADHGPGIPPHLRDLIFDPFFTTKAKGAGLGLCVADGAAKAHGGSISVESPPTGGAAFRVVLPIVPERRAPARAVGQPGEECRHGA
jgi:signal transduction histidine kinase